MGGFKPQLFYLLLQLTKVSQENLLFCPLSLFEINAMHKRGPKRRQKLTKARQSTVLNEEIPVVFLCEVRFWQKFYTPFFIGLKQALIRHFERNSRKKTEEHKGKTQCFNELLRESHNM